MRSLENLPTTIGLMTTYNMGDVIDLDKYRIYDFSFLSDTFSLIRGFMPGDTIELGDLFQENKLEARDADFWKRVESRFVTKYNAYQCEQKISEKFK